MERSREGRAFLTYPPPNMLPSPKPFGRGNSLLGSGRMSLEAFDGLPPRLSALVPLLAAGNRNDEIGVLLHLEKHTIEKYVSEIKQAVGARDPVDLVLWCRERGW